MRWAEDMASLTVAVAGGPDGDPASLADWLLEADELRGAVRLVAPPPAEGELGSIAQELLIALGPGTGVTAVAGIVIAWLRRRVGNVRLKIHREDGASVELSAEHVRALDEEGLRAQVTQLVAALDPPGRAKEQAQEGGPAEGDG